MSFQRLTKLTSDSTIRRSPNEEEIRNSVKKNFATGYKRIRNFRDEEKWLTRL